MARYCSNTSHGQTPGPRPTSPPEESPQARHRRFEQKPWWQKGKYPSLPQKFLDRYAFRNRFWPWGFVIYRTTYASEAQWAEGLAKLNRHFDCCLPGPEIEAGRHLREGFRNVIIDDKDTLDGASVETVLKRHRKWFGTWCQMNGDTFAQPRFES